ncbi:MAG: hypothetical protein ABI874_07095, partial [Chloroflexota bacterium]
MKYFFKLAVLFLFVLTACGAQPLLPLVEVRPDLITPNGDGKDDVAQVKYTLSSSAAVTITLVSTDGKTYALRANQPRTAGDYQFLFGGVVGGAALPNGAYTLRVEAKPTDGGPTAQLEKPITIANSDTQLPQIQNFTVFPNRFTPNRDGIDDRVTISYNLTKRADVLVFLQGANGAKYPVAERPDNAIKPGEPGVHTYDYEGGVDLGAMPPPDGAYQVVAEATDAAGNVVRASAPLVVVEGGVPRAEIVGATATIAPTSVRLGSTLAFTATVANIGTVPIRTKGPWSGTQYNSLDNFNALKEYEEPGVFRIGMDFEGNSSGRPYPYRWALGEPSNLTVKTINGTNYYYLMPNQRVVVKGQIKLVDKTQFNPITPFFWVGLLHEQVRIVNDRIAPTRVT